MPVPRFVAACVAGLLCILPARGHRLDELLQASFVLMERESAQVEIRLTPGIAVVDAFLAEIDQDKDQAISAEEGRTFARTVWGDVEFWLDGQRLALKPVDQEVSPREDLLAGVGFVRLRARAGLGRLAAGEHRIVLINRHRVSMSVYLVNALAPTHPGVVIRSQKRDELQTTFRLAYTLLPSDHQAPDTHHSGREAGGATQGPP